MNKKIILNATLSDLRGRVDTLAKSVFLVAGGAVTLSLNLYLDKKESFGSVIAYLKPSWWLLLLSILLFAIVIGLLILQGYISSEVYRRQLEKNKKITRHPVRCLDYGALATGVLGFAAFFAGMVYLILAAVNLN